MTGTSETPKEYDLEERTFKFAQTVRQFLKQVPRTIANQEDGRQLIRSSGSIGANYIEANEALSKKDFVHRIKIARKEAKESVYWLRLLNLENQPGMETEQKALINEANQLLKIMSSIIKHST